MLSPMSLLLLRRGYARAAKARGLPARERAAKFRVGLCEPDLASAAEHQAPVVRGHRDLLDELQADFARELFDGFCIAHAPLGIARLERCIELRVALRRVLAGELEGAVQHEDAVVIEVATDAL